MSIVRITVSIQLNAEERDALEREMLGGAGLIGSAQASAWADFHVRRALMNSVQRANALRGIVQHFHGPKLSRCRTPAGG